MCRKLLSQPYISPIYAMLLYQWLLANKDAGGAEQRQKHINLLTAGRLNNAPLCRIRPVLLQDTKQQWTCPIAVGSRQRCWLQCSCSTTSACVCSSHIS